MKDPIIRFISLIILLFVISILFVGCNQYIHKNIAYKDGFEAAKKDISSESNPYIDYKGQAWLEGWIDGRKKL